MSTRRTGPLPRLLAPLALALLSTGPAVLAGLPPDQKPLPELGTGTYLGYAGGLYPGGANDPPAAHRALGIAAAAAIRPRDAAGLPSPAGRIVLLAIGMSNTTQEFCNAGGRPPCEAGSFVGQASADQDVNRTTLVLVDGARGGQTSDTWTSPQAANYERIRTQDLGGNGLTEAQVQVVWLKVANAAPTRSLPDADSDAVRLVRQMGTIARTLRIRYPNLAILYVSSRIYAGWATTTLNPEPWAFESGLAVNWLVEAQIEEARSGGATVDPRAGSLMPGTAAPWIAWGPYLWANGTTPRADGLTWQKADLQSDGTHPSASGVRKVGQLLLAFLKGDASSRPWFLASQPPVVARRVVPTVTSGPGRFGTVYRTSLQLHNPSDRPATGRVVFVPPAGGPRPVLPFALGAGATTFLPDVVAALGAQGPGSLELLVETGAVPVALARVFNDAGESGTAGATVDALAPEEALQSGQTGVLLVPPDLVSYRLNVGVRPLDEGAELRVTLRDAAGAVLRTTTRSHDASAWWQDTASAFLDGATLAGGESITVEVTRGAAFVWGAAADNRTGDPTLQLARALP